MPIPTPAPSPSPSGGADCDQLRTDRQNITSQIADWQARLATASSGIGPGSAAEIEKTIALLQQELATTNATIAENGCEPPPPPPGCQQVFDTPHGVFKLTGAFCEKWRSLTQPQRVSLGNPTAAAMIPPSLVDVQQFDDGLMIDKEGLYDGPHVLYGPIYTAYMARGGYGGGVFGVPTSDVVDGPGGGQQGIFEVADLAYRGDLGTFEVVGPIRDLWDALDGIEGVLGYPTSSVSATSDGVGQSLRFTGGAVYWSPTTGAHELYGPVLDRWDSLGSESSYLGYPTSGMGSWTDPSSGEEGVAATFQGGVVGDTAHGGVVEIPRSLLVAVSIRNVAIFKGVASTAQLQAAWDRTAIDRVAVESLLKIVEAVGGSVKKLSADGSTLGIFGTLKALAGLPFIKVTDGSIPGIQNLLTGAAAAGTGTAAYVALEIALAAAAAASPEVTIPAYIVYLGYGAAVAMFGVSGGFVGLGAAQIVQDSSAPVSISADGTTTVAGATPPDMDPAQVAIEPPVDPTQYSYDPGDPVVDPPDF